MDPSPGAAAQHAPIGGERAPRQPSYPHWPPATECGHPVYYGGHGRRRKWCADCEPQQRPKAERKANRGVPDGCPLTQRELRAVEAVANGDSHQDVAARYQVSPATIRNQMASAYRRLGVRNATTAAIYCFQRGWLKINGQTLHEMQGIDLPAPALGDPDGDIEVSPAKRVGLYAFDMFVRSSDPEEQVALKAIMTRAFQDAGIPINDRRRDRKFDLIEALAQEVRNRRRGA